MTVRTSLRWLSRVASVPLVITACSAVTLRPNDGTVAVRWLAAKTLADGRTVRLVYGDSSSRPPVEVLVRSTDTEVGLTVRMRNPQNYLMDLRLWCAETTLDQP